MISLTKIKKQLNEEFDLEIDNLNLKENISLIIGPSGSGKTSILNVIGTISKYDTGLYQYNGQDISKFSKKKLQKYRIETISFIFQDSNLINGITVYKNIVFGNEYVDKKYVLRIAQSLRISHLLHKKVDNLSGGEKQRINIARAIARKTEYILADEPTGSLDQANSINTYKLLKQISQELNLKVVLVSHDYIACDFADIIYLIDHGRIKKLIYKKDYACTDELLAVINGDENATN